MTDEQSPAKRFGKALYKPIAEVQSEDRPRSKLVRMMQRRYRSLRAAAANRLFERDLDTRGQQVELDHFHPERVPYEPSDWFRLRRALAACEVKPTDVFVDFGSGKGRVVYQAARYPFARVVGVEISEKLNQVASANIERSRHQLACQEIEFVTGDAAELEVPDDMTIAYFYHPFTGDTLKKVLANIVASIERSPRRVRLIYLCPKSADEIVATGRFKLVQTFKGGYRDSLVRRISIFASEDQ